MVGGLQDKSKEVQALPFLRADLAGFALPLSIVQRQNIKKDKCVFTRREKVLKREREGERERTVYFVCHGDSGDSGP